VNPEPSHRGWSCAVLMVAALLGSACHTESTDSGPTPVCVDVAGVWDLTLVSESGTGISCPDRSVTWTLTQTGCNVTIGAAASDTANGATGGISDNRLYVNWFRLESCYRYTETIDALVHGDTMTGTYYLFRGQEVYPAYCPGLGMCSAALNGVRRAP